MARLPSHLGAASVEGEECAIPCNQGRARRECTVKWTKSCWIQIKGPLSLKVGSYDESSGGYRNGRELSLDNVLRTLSYNVEVEKLEIYFPGSEIKVVKTLFKCMKTIPFLKHLSLYGLRLNSLLVAYAQSILSVLIGNNVLQTFLVCSSSIPLLEVKRSVSKGSPKDLRKGGQGSKQYGIGVGKIGEALHNNTVLERLTIQKTMVEAEEMKALMGALIPDAFSRRQPNTSLLHLEFQNCSVGTGGEKEWMEHLTTMLQSNTSLISLDLSNLAILMEDNQDSAEYVEMLFTSLWSNTSLEELYLRGCSAIKGKQMLGIIGDMLLHNHTLMDLDMGMTGLDEDGDAELVYAELRARITNTDLGLMKQLECMGRVPPIYARVFLCGSGEAGKMSSRVKFIKWFKDHGKHQTQGRQGQQYHLIEHVESKCIKWCGVTSTLAFGIWLGKWSIIPFTIWYY